MLSPRLLASPSLLSRLLYHSLRGCNLVFRGFSGKMERAVVRCVPGESKLTLSFTLNGSHKHMLREQNEELGKALARISNGLIKTKSKGKKSKTSKTTEPAPETVPEPLVCLYFNGDSVAEESLNSEAWRDGAVLQVGETRYRIERNPPTFTTAELPASLLSGFPVCPKLEIEFGELEHCKFTWYKESFPNAHAQLQPQPQSTAEGAASQITSQPRPESTTEGATSQITGCWLEAGSERVFTPSNLDIGLKLKLKCTPGNKEARYGLAKELLTSGVVEAGPGVCTFDNRHMYTRKVTAASTVRVVSYNILADIYAQTELSRTVLYPYCAPYALGLDYRHSLIKKELAGYNADIVCLQEVDKGAFSDSLCPALDAFGMDGVFRMKEKQHEGLATFYRRSKFRLLGQHDITLSETLTTDDSYNALLQIVSTNPALKEKVVQRSTALQVTVLQSESDPSKIVYVGNTHLYWHPKGGNVRLIQMAVALQHLKQVREEVPGTLVLCGDFNSIPSSGLVQLLVQGSVPETHGDWASNGQEELIRTQLLNPFQLISACGEPDYTNYVGGFHGCLDYIFTEPRALQVEQVIPLPSHQEVTTYQALPSVAHPSDHIALICDLHWK